MSDPVMLALELAEAQCTGPQICAALVREAELPREHAAALVARMGDELAEAKLHAQSKVLRHQYRVAQGLESQVGERSRQEWCVQYCGWSREGVDQPKQEAVGRALPRHYKSTTARGARA